MSIQIEGPRKSRSNADAAKGIQMTADEVRWYIDRMDRQTKDIGARKVVATNAIKFGNITDEGKDVYREYLRQLGDA